MRRSLFYFLLIFFFFPVAGQNPGTEASVSLEKLFSRLEKIFEDKQRISINDSIVNIIADYVRSDSVMEHNFTQLRHLGQITAPDNQVKIVTWNLILADSPNRYFCYLVKKGEHGGPNNVIYLTGVNKEEPIRTDLNYSAADWYGALYYDIKPIKIRKETNYILLGIDFGNRKVNRKIIDVLSFSSSGDIVFGKQWFQSGNSLKYRDVFEYDASGAMSLKFTSGKSIVFDHLVPLSKRGEENSYGAEYTFDRYVLKKNLWVFERNINVKNEK